MCDYEEYDEALFAQLSKLKNKKVVDEVAWSDPVPFVHRDGTQPDKQTAPERNAQPSPVQA